MNRNRTHLMKRYPFLPLLGLLIVLITGCSESYLDFPKLSEHHEPFFKKVKTFIDSLEKDTNTLSKEMVDHLLKDKFQKYVEDINKKYGGLIEFSIDDAQGTQLVNGDTTLIGKTDIEIILDDYNSMEKKTNKELTVKDRKNRDIFVRITNDNRQVILSSDSAMFVSYPWHKNKKSIYKIALGEVVGSKYRYIVYTSDNLTEEIVLQLSKANYKWLIGVMLLITGVSIFLYWQFSNLKNNSRKKMKGLLNTIIGRIREEETKAIFDDYSIARIILKKNVVEELLKVIEVRKTEGLRISIMLPAEDHRLINYEYLVNNENEEINIQEYDYTSNWLPVVCLQNMIEFIRHTKTTPFDEKSPDLIVLPRPGIQNPLYAKDPFEDYETVCLFPLVPFEKGNKIFGIFGVYSKGSSIIPGHQQSYLRYLATLISLLVENYQYARKSANTIQKSMGNIISAKLFQKVEIGNETVVDDINLVNREILKGIAQPLIMLLGYSKEEAEGMSVCLGLVDESNNRLDCLIVENPRFIEDQPDALIIDSFAIEETISYSLSENNRPAIWCLKRNTPIFSNNWANDMLLEKFNDYGFSLKDAPGPKYGLPAVSLAYYPLCQVDTNVFGIFSIINVKKEVDFESEVYRNIVKSTAEHLQASILGFIKLTQKQKQIELIRDISRLILHESKNKFKGLQFALENMGDKIKEIEKSNSQLVLETTIWDKYMVLKDNLIHFGISLKNDHDWIKSIGLNDSSNNDEVNLKDLIESVLKEFILFNLKIDLNEIDETLVIVSNERYLRLIFSTLIYNAIAYKIPEKDVEIKVSVIHNDSNNKTIIRIKDNACGIENPEILLNNIRSKPVYELSGVGLKLAIEHIEKRLKGKFTIVSSVINEGTEIEIEL